VLHSLSFIDDPTRVLRAVRLGLRLGFEISPETLHLVGVALSEGVFDRLSGARLREELILLLDDPALAVRGLERLEGLGVLRALHPALSLEEPGRSHGERLRRAVAAWDWYTVEGLSEPPAALWRLVLLALTQGGFPPGGGEGSEGGGGLPPEAVRELADRLMLSGDDHELLTGGGRRLEEAALALRRPGVRPHEVSEALERLAGEELLLLVASEDEAVRDWARRELSELRPLELGVRGRDLVERGFPPGRRIGEALEAVRRARLDGEIGPDEELAAALAFLEERSTVPAGERAGAGP
jgi:tRNA nucleotidyltransferase (CCA-adding enzyme)